MANYFNHLYDSFRIRCTRVWYDLKYGVLNLIKWFPVIWNDRNWDYSYANEILIRKLEMMRDHFMEEKYVLNSRFYGLRINTVINILNKVQSEDYTTEYLEYYNQDFNIDSNGVLHWEDDPYDNLGMFFDKYPRVYKQAVKSLPRQYVNSGTDKQRVGIAIQMCNINQKRATELAYRIISTYSPRWWD